MIKEPQVCDLLLKNKQLQKFALKNNANDVKTAHEKRKITPSSMGFTFEELVADSLVRKHMFGCSNLIILGVFYEFC